MPTTEVVVLVAILAFVLLVVLIAETTRSDRLTKRLEGMILRERAEARKAQSELLDRLLEKETLSRFAQGIPVPDAVLQRVEPQSNGSTPTYSGPMNAEIQETIEQMRAYGMSEAEIASELNKVRR